MRIVAILFLVTVSGCVVARRVSDADASSIALINNSDLCRTAVKHPSYMTPVAWAEVKKRNLGDCSEPQVACIDAGFVSGTEKFAECKLQMTQLKLAIDAADARQAAQDFGNNLGQNITNAFRPQPRPQRTYTTCTGSPYTNSVDCTSW